MTLQQKIIRFLAIQVLLILITIGIIGYIFQVWKPGNYTEQQRLFFTLYLVIMELNYMIWRR